MDKEKAAYRCDAGLRGGDSTGGGGCFVFFFFPNVVNTEAASVSAAGCMVFSTARNSVAKEDNSNVVLMRIPAAFGRKSWQQKVKDKKMGKSKRHLISSHVCHTKEQHA